MNFWKSVDGVTMAELTGADPGKTLYMINQAGIRMTQIEWKDQLTIQFCCARRDRKLIREICKKRGDDLRFSKEKGLYYLGKRFISRPVLLTGILFFLGLSLFLPTRILFFQVEGNEAIPTRQILEAAEECGIRFGVSRRAVRSEKMKNALLAAVPELKWAGINTAGCTAVISVREREFQEQTVSSAGVSSIVALRDGYITSCTVTRGNALCVPGQVVQEGQVLISGYTDLGICIQLTQAQGEVFAETSRDFQAISPSEQVLRLENRGVQKRYSLVLGKKRINLWKGSGISDVTCGRMYEEYYITLPGEFRLPVCIGVESLTDWKTTVMELPPDTMEDRLISFARQSVLKQTVAGSILREDHAMIQEDSRYILTSRFLCSEMIGRVITEEIGEINGKTD